MKLIAIAVKDLKLSFRNYLALGFTFLMPVLFTVLFAFMFGGVGTDEQFEISQVDLAVVNLDEGSPYFEFSPKESEDTAPKSAQSGELDFTNVNGMGDILVQLLKADFFSDFLSPTEVDGEAQAKALVDAQEADMALIIPQDFTAELLQENGHASVLLYQDPTLTVTPAVVKSILNLLLDQFSSARIAMEVADKQLAEAGLQMSPEQAQSLIQSFASYDSTNEQSVSAEGGNPYGSLLEIIPPSGEEENVNVKALIIAPIISGMLVFYAFYTGTASMESILKEQESGTLARLFTTPTSSRTIFGGKLIATFVLLFFQALFMIFFGFLSFRIDWGTPMSILLTIFGTVLLAGATGSFLASFIHNKRQSGIIMGGFLTLSGMLGMLPTFFAGWATAPQAVVIASKLVPQGWVLQLFSQSFAHSSVSEMLPTLMVVIGWSILFAFIGQYRLQKGFA